MQYKILTVLITVLILTGMVSGSSAGGWLIYHKPEFRGKVIDAETKQPIEGAVVVAVYYKSAIRMAPESVSIIKHIQETLTSKEGIFLIPSYSSLTDPLSFNFWVTFIIFKPGYGNFPDWSVYPPKGMKISFEEFFPGKLGGAKEVWVEEPWKARSEAKKEKIYLGIVELPKLKTWKEREKALSIPNLPLEAPCNKIKNLVSLLRKEYISLGYKSYEHWMENCK